MASEGLGLGLWKPMRTRHTTLRAYLRGRGIKANMLANPRNRHGRPYGLKGEAYKRMRSSVERFFAWLKCGFRRLAMRYERLETTFIAFVQLACMHNIPEIFEMSSMTDFLYLLFQPLLTCYIGLAGGERRHLHRVITEPL